MFRKSRLLLTASAVAVVAVPITIATTANAGEPAQPPLQLVGATSTVTYERWSADEDVYLDLGAHVVAGRTAFELEVARKSYQNPIVARQITRVNGVRKTRNLPAGLVKDFGGLDRFLNVKVVDGAGKTVFQDDQTFCPNGDAARTRPDASDTSPYPQVCGSMPFTLASVWGLQAGWGVNAAGGGRWGSPGGGAKLPDGTYTATASVNKAHRDAFGIPANKSTVTVKLVVRTVQDPGGPQTPEPTPSSAAPQRAAKAHGDDHASHSAAAHKAAERAKKDPGYRAPGFDGPEAPKGFSLKPNKARPTGPAKVPTVAAAPRPDLRSLPAWDIHLGGFDAPDGTAEPGKEYLSFSANVWNAGPSPLVVDGFRRNGADLMDAYQYFYDAKGKQVGWAPAGTMEWDAREGHTHWHFTDFATYRLLDATKKVAVRSGKEAFCLLPTDPVDLRVKGAHWKPASTDLRTACGGETAIAIRETLDVGWGDTYSQNLPGQSFDVTGLANGTYYIEVKANPANRLHESSTANNTSLRKVVISGAPGARTVTVPPYDLVDAP